MRRLLWIIPVLLLASCGSRHGGDESSSRAFPQVRVPSAVSEEDGVIEAIEHESLPIAAFQFHPEKYWTKDQRFLELIRRALAPFPLTTSH